MQGAARRTMPHDGRRLCGPWPEAGMQQACQSDSPSQRRIREGQSKQLPLHVESATTTTITNLPDGSVEKKTEVVNPDGSKPVTVTVEKPE